MKNIDLTRAWKDPLYRSTLNLNELSALPENPAGLMEVTDEELAIANGGTTAGCSAVLSIISVTVITYYQECLRHTWTRSCPSK